MEFLKHLSKERLDNFNPNKCHSITENELLKIWSLVLLSNDSILVDIRLTLAESILDSIFIKAIQIKDEVKKNENISKLEELNLILLEAKDIIKINRVQADIIKKSNIDAFAMKKEIKKLNDTINFINK